MSQAHEVTGADAEAAGRVDLDLEGNGIAWLRVNNPRRYNAMSLSMWRDLARHVRTAGDDPGVRVLAVTGTGRRAFVSGADISEFDALRDSSGQVQAYDQAVHDAQHALVQCDKPSVAVINGLCMGGGIGIALACDVRFCATTTRFRMPAARLGLGYDIAGLRRAVDVIGYANTADIFFSARTFHGAEAQRLGLVNQCFPDEHFAILAGRALNDIVGNAPLTLRAAKRALRYILNGAHDTVDDVERAISDCFKSDDYREGRRAFREKREPVFRGR